MTSNFANAQQLVSALLLAIIASTTAISAAIGPVSQFI